MEIPNLTEEEKAAQVEEAQARLAALRDRVEAKRHRQDPREPPEPDRLPYKEPD